MWAHYADSHHGFVAEFRHGEEGLEDSFRVRAGPFGPAAKVKYLRRDEQQAECKRDASNIERILWTKHAE